MPLIPHLKGKTGNADLKQISEGISNPIPEALQIPKQPRPILDDLQIKDKDELKSIEFVNICKVNHGRVEKIKAKVLNKPYMNSGDWFVYLSIDGDKTPYSLAEYSVMSHHDGTWNQDKWFEKIMT